MERRRRSAWCDAAPDCLCLLICRLPRAGDRGRPARLCVSHSTECPFVDTMCVHPRSFSLSTSRLIVSDNPSCAVMCRWWQAGRPAAQCLCTYDAAVPCAPAALGELTKLQFTMKKKSIRTTWTSEDLERLVKRCVYRGAGASRTASSYSPRQCSKIYYMTGNQTGHISPWTGSFRFFHATLLGRPLNNSTGGQEVCSRLTPFKLSTYTACAWSRGTGVPPCIHKR